MKNNNHKNILIIIDNQNGFTTTKKTKQISNRIVNLTNSNIFDYQIATQYFNNINSEKNLFTKLQNWYKLQDQKEIDYVDNLKYDVSLRKDIYGAVNNEMLQTLKKANNNQMPQYVFICGMDTECCVLKTCTDLFENGIVPILLNKYTYSNSGYFAHDRGIKVFKRLVSPKAFNNQYVLSKQNLKDMIISLNIL